MAALAGALAGATHCKVVANNDGDSLAVDLHLLVPNLDFISLSHLSVVVMTHMLLRAGSFLNFEILACDYGENSRLKLKALSFCCGIIG